MVLCATDVTSTIVYYLRARLRACKVQYDEDIKTSLCFCKLRLAYYVTELIKGVKTLRVIIKGVVMLRVRMLRVIMLRSSMPRARASLYAGTSRVRFDSLESLRHDFIDELLAVIVGLH